MTSLVQLFLQHLLKEKKGKGCDTRPLRSKAAVLISISRPFNQEVQWGMRASHPMLLHTLPVYLPRFSRYPFRAGSSLNELRESCHWPHPKPNNWLLATLGFEPSPSQTKVPKSSTPIHLARMDSQVDWCEKGNESIRSLCYETFTKKRSKCILVFNSNSLAGLMGIRLITEWTYAFISFFSLSF